MEEILTLEQENAILELQRLMEGERLPTEMYDARTILYKFLKARDYNVKKAEVMLRKCIRWRKELQMHNLLRDHEQSEILVKHIIQPHLGFDKEGYPVRYCPIGMFDIAGLFKSGNYLSGKRRSLSAIEEDILLQKRQSEKLGRLITKSVYIFDIQGMTVADILQKKGCQYMLDLASTLQDNYPEFLHKLYVINVPDLFCSIAWPIFKTIVASSVTKKIHFYAKDGWKEEFLRTIDADVLPAFLGGNRTDPDGNPKCVTLVGNGEKIAEKFYKVKNIDDLAQKPRCMFLKLERQEMFNIPVQIKNIESVIHWEFETRNHDIGFGLYYEESNGNAIEEIIPVHRVNTELEPEIGKYRCENCTGKYVIVFDNSYSRFYPKELYYRVWIKDDDGIKIIGD